MTAAPSIRAKIILAKNAANRYRGRPAHLDSIVLGLSDAAPAFILAAVEHRARGLAGARPIHLAGAAIYARWLRRFGTRADVATSIAAE